MRIAVTYDNGKIFQHFGHSRFFKLYETENGTILASGLITANGEGHGALATLLAQKKVDVLLCGGIGQGALDALDREGILVVSGTDGRADEAVRAYLDGKLVSGGVTCHCHDHEEEHSCSCGHHHDCEDD